MNTEKSIPKYALEVYPHRQPKEKYIERNKFTHRFPIVRSQGLGSMMRSAPQAGSHDRKRSFCDFLSRRFFITHGWGRMKSQTACIKLEAREALAPVSWDSGGRVEGSSGLDILRARLGGGKGLPGVQRERKSRSSCMLPSSLIDTVPSASTRSGDP